MNRTQRPQPDEVGAYYFRYIDQVGDGDICRILHDQVGETLALLGGISEEGSNFRYAPDKWSIREVVSHLNDTERLFAFRAFWFARGMAEPQPSFDQDVAVAHSGAAERSFADHLAEFRAVRAATCALFDGLAPEAWDRRGTASGNPFSVRAAAYVCAGHLIHHQKLFRERYRLANT